MQTSFINDTYIFPAQFCEVIRGTTANNPRTNDDELFMCHKSGAQLSAVGLQRGQFIEFLRVDIVTGIVIEA